MKILAHKLSIALLLCAMLGSWPHPSQAAPASLPLWKQAHDIKVGDFADACRNRKNRSTTSIRLTGWKSKPSNRKIKRDLRNFRSLAKCNPGLKILKIAPQENKCKIMKRNQRLLNRHYGKSLRRIFPRTAIFYGSRFASQCDFRKATKDNIGPARVGLGMDLEKMPAKGCPEPYGEPSVLEVHLIKMRSDPAKWDKKERQQYRDAIARNLPRLIRTKNCPSLRVVILSIPAGLYSRNARIYGDHAYKANTDAFRKKHGAEIRRLLPNMILMLGNSGW